MSSSPSSNATSSDLYSPSENPEIIHVRSARLPSVENEQPAEDYIAFHSIQSNDQLVDQINRKEPVFVQSVTEEADTTILYPLGLPNGHISAPQKRKWDEVEDPKQDLREQQGESARGVQDLSESKEIDHPPQKRQLNPTIWSRVSRSHLPESPSNPLNHGRHAHSSGLPDEIWQHIFSFVPPVFLGRLLSVNRVFHACLTKATAERSDETPTSHKAIKSVSANSVWASSRKRFAPGLPKPLHDLGELEMWRLLRGRPCQICGEVKNQNYATSADSPLESGPGDKGVRILWPFGIRTCGSCLQKRSEKESALYISPECPYFLLSALPFAFVTATNHFVSNAALQGMAHLPPLKMEKHYYKPHIEDIRRRLAEAKLLGPASVEEWMKGLSSEGKERHDDALRWEQWEVRGGLKKVNAKAPAKQSSTLPFPKIGPSISQIKPEKPENHPTRSTPLAIPLPAKPPVDLGGSAPLSADSTHPAPLVMSQYQPPWTAPVTYPESFAQRPPGSLPQPRPERNIRDVNEAKAIRKAEIERRCQELQPPLPLSILNHMESFQAAIQISQPLTEHAWEVLKPRLLAQRPYAERKEKEKIQQDELLQEEYKQRRQQETQLKETKEALDREWDTVQAPVRNRISALADDYIAESWSNGASVSKDTSPKFAADVLTHVRERFYADIAQEDEEARIAGQLVKVDQPNEPPTRKLILENMKWLFDTKVKPLTENYQKELFLCNGCEGNFKFYGFEGVVQHYAAKHTNILSMGSVVVHWRAEWPENPPFNPNPSAAKAAYYKIPTPVNTSTQVPINGDGQSQHSYGYVQGLDSNPASRSAQQVYQNADIYSAPNNSFQQKAQHAFSAEQGFHAYTTANIGSVPVTTSNTGPGIGYPGPSQMIYPTTNQGYNSYPQVPFSQPASAYTSQYPPQQYPPYTQGQEHNVPGSHMTDLSSQYYGAATTAQQPSSYTSRPISLHQSGLAPEVYQKQLDELAKYAREVWFGTSGIKDIPQSVRIFVVIHHAASRYTASFSTEPTLAMFIDGLDNHPKMRPVRSLNGLACKTCVHASSTDGQQTFMQHSVADRKLYTLPHLLNHFRTTHIEGGLGYPEHSYMSSPGRLDWKRDMIELPEIPLIADLVHAQGVDDNKLSLIASVFPEAFPNPLPTLGKRPGNVGPVPVYRANPMSTNPSQATFTHYDQIRTVNSPNDSQAYTRPASASRMASSRAQSSEPAGEDEYDPHRPAYLGRIIKPDAAVAPSRHQDFALSRPEHRPSGHYDGQNFAQYNSTVSLTSAHATNGLPSNAINGEPGPYYRTEHHPDWNGTRESPDKGHLQGQFNETYAVPSERQNYHVSNQRAYDENNTTTSHRLPEKLAPNGEEISTQYNNNASPIEAADRFLRSLPVSKTNPSNLTDHAARSRPTSAWPDTARNIDQDRRHNGGFSTQKWNDVQSDPRDGSDSHPIIDSIRAASLIQKAVEDSASSHKVKAEAPQDDEYRPPTHVQVALSSNRVEHSPQPYERGIGGRHVITRQQYAVNDTIRQADDRIVSYHLPREPRYRDRSRSPKPSQAERGFYRSRSPRVETRDESVYHVISPASHKESQPQRIFSYDYPVRDRFEYIENRLPAEDRYGRRVEYVPVRYEDHHPADTGRYVLASRYEEPAAPPGYVRVEKGYGAEQFYERDGQLYRAGPSTQTFAQEYRY